MLTPLEIIGAIPYTLEHAVLPTLGLKREGKVRDIYSIAGQRVLITTDRVSAFDRVVGAIPFKGQVLNQLSEWWFAQTADLVKNHVIAVPDPNVMIAHEAEALPVEVIVRGYITGVTSTALWTLYAAGERTPYGIPLPDGLQKNDPLPTPIITPTTKATGGAHDERLTREDIIERGLVPQALWEQVEQVALALFARGQEVARRAGLILVDTKYEFGLINGQLALIDEIHTPDSSRYWTLESYGAGRDPQNFDKEILREWFVAQGYRGEGAIPAMPPQFVAKVAERYIGAYERLTGETFIPGEQPALSRIARALEAYTHAQSQPLVVLLLGSRADLDHAHKITKVLDELGVPTVIRIGSAHKTPDHVQQLLRHYEADGRQKVYITIAGRSNALSGFTDAQVVAPVIACPPPSEAFGGADIYSSLRMPSGVAPAVVLEPSGAALLAAKILGVSNPAIREAVAHSQAKARDRIVSDDQELNG
jgi:phosphoribosylaminoimidazole-succinocarboxamide synthase